LAYQQERAPYQGLVDNPIYHKGVFK